MREFQKGQRVYQLVTYGAGLTKRHCGIVRKLGARGARVRFDNGEELWVGRNLYLDTTGTTSTTTDTSEETMNKTERTQKTEKIDRMTSGAIVQFMWQNRMRKGTVLTANDRIVQVRLDEGGIAWPRRCTVKIVDDATAADEAVSPAEAPSAASGAVTPNLTLVPPPSAAPSAPSAPQPQAHAQSSPVSPASPVAFVAPVQARSQTGTTGRSAQADWVKELADHAARLLGNADSSVQDAQAKAARLRSVVEKATRGVEDARRLLAEAEAEFRQAEADVAEVMDKRDALLRIVRGGKATP
jgi:hypothetical protein